MRTTLVTLALVSTLSFMIGTAGQEMQKLQASDLDKQFVPIFNDSTHQFYLVDALELDKKDLNENEFVITRQMLGKSKRGGSILIHDKRMKINQEDAELLYEVFGMMTWHKAAEVTSITQLTEIDTVATLLFVGKGNKIKYVTSQYIRDIAVDFKGEHAVLATNGQLVTSVTEGQLMAMFKQGDYKFFQKAKLVPDFDQTTRLMRPEVGYVASVVRQLGAELYEQMFVPAIGKSITGKTTFVIVPEMKAIDIDSKVGQYGHWGLGRKDGKVSASRIDQNDIIEILIDVDNNDLKHVFQLAA